MTRGYMGKIMMVDLSSGSIEVEQVPDAIYEQVLGGGGLAARLLYDRIPAGADPLGPDNILGFMSGLLTGSGAHFSGRWMLAGKSPLTGGWGEANCGGKLSPAIKRCGVDGIFFRGISDKPVYLRVVRGEAELVDASHLWGMDAVEAEKAIREEVGIATARIAVIGTAGEKQSLISGVNDDGGRIAARSGMGAVMGSKRLKAIALASKEKIGPADRKAVIALNKKFDKWFKPGLGLGRYLKKNVVDAIASFFRASPVDIAYTGDLIRITFARFGTICTNTLSSEIGDSPAKNWGGAGSVDYPLATHSTNINPVLITDREVKKYNCYSCPLGCGGIVHFQVDGETIQMHKPEYETCAAFGTLVLNRDLDSIFTINNKLNRAAMDTISAGTTVAFAMDCYDQGILSRKELDGLDLRWGNSQAIIALVDKMIAREGCGELFADGVKVAAAKIGKDSERLAMHAGGQELPMHDTRFDPGFAVAYSCEPTPGRHTNYGYQWLEVFALHKLFKGLPKMPDFYFTEKRYVPTREKNELLVAGSKYMQAANGCGMCLFGLMMGGRLPLPQYINAATGWNHRPEHYLEVGHRIQSIRQAFNVKHGVQPGKDFKLPLRALGLPPLQKGPLKGITLDQERLRRDFFEGMGWDRGTAVPTPQTLERLGLQDIAAEIHGSR